MSADEKKTALNPRAAWPFPPPRLTNLEREVLARAAGLVLAGEWPWEPEKAGEREALESAKGKLE